MENDKNELKDFFFKKRLPRPLFYLGLIIGMVILIQINIPKFPKNDKDLIKEISSTLILDKKYEDVK